MASMTPIQNCCVAMLMSGFNGIYETNKESYLNRLATDLRDARNMGHSLDQLAVVTAYTTTAQTLANECLTEIGFETIKVLPKAKHPETDLNCWLIPAPQAFIWANARLAKVASKAAQKKKTEPAVTIEWSEDYTLENL